MPLADPSTDHRCFCITANLAGSKSQIYAEDYVRNVGLLLQSKSTYNIVHRPSLQAALWMLKWDATSDRSPNLAEYFTLPSPTSAIFGAFEHLIHSILRSSLLDFVLVVRIEVAGMSELSCLILCSLFADLYLDVCRFLLKRVLFGINV